MWRGRIWCHSQLIPARDPTVPWTDGMDVRVEYLGSGSTVVRVIGVIDAKAAATRVERWLGLALRPGTVRAHVLLDLSGVVVLDRCGLDALLRFHNMLENGHGTIELLNSAPVLRLFITVQEPGW